MSFRNTFNPVIRTKTYDVWNGHRKLGQVQADNVSEAFTKAKLEWPARTCVTLAVNSDREPMWPN